MEYEMSLKDVRGYQRLKKWQQEILEKVYKKHMNVVENKENWQIKSVMWDKTYLKVRFMNGEWLHYTVDGYWY